MKIIHTNTHRVAQQSTELKEAVQFFNDVINELNALNIGIQIKNSEDLTELVNDPDTWIKTKLLQGVESQTVTVFGIALKTKPAKLIELIDMPDLNTLTVKCKVAANNVHLLRRISVTGKKASINSNAIEEITHENSIIANTSHAKEASEALTAISKGISEYNAIARTNEGSPLNGYNISHAFNLTGKEPQLNEQFLRSCGLFN